MTELEHARATAKHLGKSHAAAGAKPCCPPHLADHISMYAAAFELGRARQGAWYAGQRRRLTRRRYGRGTIYRPLRIIG